MQYIKKCPFAFYSVLNLLILILLGCLCYNRNRLDSYMSIVLPMILTAEIFLYYCFKAKADIKLCVPVIILFEIGQTLQVLLAVKENLYLYIILVDIISIAGMCCYQFADRLNRLSEKGYFKLMLITSGLCALIVVTLLFCKPYNGTRAWLTIGGKPVIQLTEFLKPLFIIAMAAIFCSNVKRMWLYSAALAAFVCGSLALLGELGTLLVIFLIWVSLCFLFFEKKRVTAYLSLAFISVGTIGLLLCRSAYNKVQRDAAMGEKTSSGVIRTMSRVFYKLLVRTEICFNLDKADPYGEAMQAIKAREAMIKGGLLGSTETVKIPVAASDYAFISLLLRCGIFFAITVLILFAIIYVQGNQLFYKQKNTFRSVTIIGFVYTLIYPTIINILGTTNFMPMTGIPIPFISYGGVSLCITFLIVTYLLCCSGNDFAVQFISRLKALISTSDDNVGSAKKVSDEPFHR